MTRRGSSYAPAPAPKGVGGGCASDAPLAACARRAITRRCFTPLDLSPTACAILPKRTRTRRFVSRRLLLLRR